MWVFLDIDGVLNSRASFREPEGELDVARIARLDHMVDAAGASIVLSSSWRIDPGLEPTIDRLRERGLRATVVGATPRIGDRPRGAEIAAWLLAHGSASRWGLALGVSRQPYVILDDDRGAGDGHGERFVHVVDGLEDVHVERALRRLGAKAGWAGRLAQVMTRSRG